MEFCLGVDEKLTESLWDKIKARAGTGDFLPWSSLTVVPAPLPELQKAEAVIGKEPPAVGDDENM